MAAKPQADSSLKIIALKSIITKVSTAKNKFKVSLVDPVRRECEVQHLKIAEKFSLKSKKDEILGAVGFKSWPQEAFLLVLWFCKL